jgi:tRNA pseudouridine55 synthase
MTDTTKPARVRIVRRPVHGVLLLDKPLQLSSNDALQKAKWLMRAEKAGHTGTLDPLATGVLPLCFGAATKFSQIQLDANKTYEATLRFGSTTTTADAEGAVLQERPVSFTWDELAAVLQRFQGKSSQVPPMHSALKKDGKPLYEYARAGITLQRAPREIELFSIKFAQNQHVVQHPRSLDAIKIVVQCSKGTYIRTLAEDIGKHLGCGAHLKALRRTGSGSLSIEHSHSLEQLAAMSEQERDAALMPADRMLADWPEVLNDEDAGRFLTGMRRRLPLVDTPNVRVYGPPAHTFLGSGHVTAGELISTRLLSPLEVQYQASN